MGDWISENFEWIRISNIELTIIGQEKGCVRIMLAISSERNN
jgi:hypothetical protein